MTQFLRFIELIRYYIGLVGIFGILAGALAVASVLFLIVPAQQHAEAMKQEIGRLSTLPVQKKVEVTPVLTQAENLEKFYSQFPTEKDLPEIVEQLHQLAAQEGIVLPVGDYKLLNDPNKRLKRYEMIFPVNAKYMQLRSFIHHGQVKFPTLALSEINIKRESIKDNEAEINLNYVLLMRRTD